MNAPSPRTAFSVLPAVVAAVLLLCLPASAGEVFSKPPTPGGGVNASSWIDPDGSDSDMYSWDDFVLAETQTITEVRWRGGYKFNGLYSKAIDFRVSFFDSTSNGFWPIITGLPEHEDQETVIATFHTNNIAGESYAGVSGGVVMYDYHFTLPTPVTLQAGVKYWFRVVAGQTGGYPDWGMTSAGSGNHFVYNQGASMFQNWPNELAFSLHALWADMGQGLAGSAGVPELSGSGTLASGSSCSLELSQGQPVATMWMVIGFTELNAPFKGGTLVPNPLFLVDMNTNGLGAASLPFVMPAGVPSGTDIVTQAWIADAAAVSGLAASNGLVATTP